MKKLFSFLVFTVFLFGCSHKTKLSLSEISLLGTTWNYTDKDRNYEIEFSKKGKLITTHPNDHTPNNDTWKQKGDKIHFEFNDGFSKYDGQFESINLIKGTAKNSVSNWKWTIKRAK